MAEFWLISVPLDKTSSQSVEKLKHTAAKANLGTCFKFHVPELKVGTLDVLLSVSDELSKLDTYAESVMRKTTQCMAEVMESGDKPLGTVSANGVPTEQKGHCRLSQSPMEVYFQAQRVDVATYVTKFQWDKAKYSTTLPLKTLTEMILKQVAQIETELKSRSAAYSNVKSTLHVIKQKAEGSLQTRSLTDIVKKEDLVLNSEYLTTLLVVVPRMSVKQWENSYESMSDFVVPRSSRKLLEEDDAVIFTVTLFKKAIGKFKDNAKKHHFTVREFNVEEAERQKQELKCLSLEKKEQYGTFVRWLKMNFSEVFVAWIHVKALRVFAESVIRYGLPISFQAFLVQPQKKQVKRLREELNSLFIYLDPIAAASKQDVGLDIPEVNTGQQEYYSYICFPINIHLVDFS